ncbi:MAG TPA: hypothetical protein VH969_29260 [Actinophytocola sp.]|jgi:hypothetical protein|uniref:hypothetical protein n=1 Tax=Actinophytocola sp. TaxID=1872138 RepID=UPI002F94E8E9
MTHGTPTLHPPTSDGTTETDVPGSSQPTAFSDRQVALRAAESMPLAGPVTVPPAMAAEAVGEVTGTWRNNVKIDALWAIDETRNAWVRVAGLGWRKIYNGRDGAFTALLTLASQARQTGRPINVREEADGMIYEIYLW